jgi:hypothetical protein
MAKPEDEAFLLSNAEREDEGSEDEEYKPINKTRACRSYLLLNILVLSGILNIFQGFWITSARVSVYPKNHIGNNPFY